MALLPECGRGARFTFPPWNACSCFMSRVPHFASAAEGRIIAVGLLVLGLAAFGVFTASLVSWVLRD
jgi:hypothetical protein